LFLVDRPTLPPGTCIVNHSNDDPGGFIDLGDRAIIDPRVYVSRQAVIDLGRRFGFPTPDEYADQARELERLEGAVLELESEIRQLTRDVEAAEWTLERKFQAKPQNKPGRKPAKVTN
jgi:hypothetical protein